jgi:hypothetical protein
MAMTEIYRSGTHLTNLLAICLLTGPSITSHDKDISAGREFQLFQRECRGYGSKDLNVSFILTMKTFASLITSDMVFNRGGNHCSEYNSMKLAIANVATQDSYNRKGNLFHCDLNKGISQKLEGHTRFDQRLNQGTRFFLRAAKTFKKQV